MFSGHLGGLAFGATLIGGNGTDTASFWDTGEFVGHNYYVTDSFLSTQSKFFQLDTERVHLNVGSAKNLLDGSASHVPRYLVGGGGDDTIYGGSNNDVIGGGGGDDLIVGNAGQDHLWGNDGDDRLTAGDGAGGDWLDGGLGWDILRYDAGDTFKNGETNVLTSAVTGNVFNDANGNGIKDAGETDLASVFVFFDANNDGIYSPWLGDRGVMTDAKGNYVLGDLNAGVVHIAGSTPEVSIRPRPPPARRPSTSGSVSSRPA